MDHARRIRRRLARCGGFYRLRARGERGEIIEISTGEVVDRGSLAYLAALWAQPGMAPGGCCRRPTSCLGYDDAQKLATKS